MALEALEAIANQGFVIAEEPRGCRCRGLRDGGGLRFGGCRLIEGGGLHHEWLHHQLHLFGGHRQLLECADQIVLEPFHPPGDGVGLAGKAAVDFLLEGIAAARELADLLLERLALLTQFAGGELLPVVGLGCCGGGGVFAHGWALT